MTLAAGTVTVGDDGVRTGSGMALSLYDQLVAIPGMIRSDTEIPDPTIRAQCNLAMKRSAALQSTAMATGIISYFTANAVVSGNAHVTTQSLGVTPNPNNPSTAIVSPSSPVDIPVSGGIS
jgi:hypothetical protein